MPAYDMGDPALDQLIAELVAATGEGEDQDLIGEIVTTALKLYRDQPDRGDLKLFNTALKEMRYSALVFAAYRDIPKVTIFGSARTPDGHPEYELAESFARHMVEERNWMVITGAGPGIMEAGNRGAGSDKSFGVNIRLPFEAHANEFVDEKRLINFKYFFTRKLGFVKESNAFTIFPGGFGTMDETFELLTLVQTGKAPVHPIVLMEAGNSYWPTWQSLVHDELLEQGWISENDKHLYKVTDDINEAADEICGFYSNYQSQRYVNGRLVLRHRQSLSDAEIEQLNDEYADVLVSGMIERSDPSDHEVTDNDALDCDRLVMHFDRKSFGRLRLLINQINAFSKETPAQRRPSGSHFLDDPD